MLVCVLGAVDFLEGRRSSPEPHSGLTHLYYGPLVESRYVDVLMLLLLLLMMMMMIMMMIIRKAASEDAVNAVVD